MSAFALHRVAAAAAVLAALACGGASPSSPHTAAAASPAGRAQVWMSFAACLRAHGASEPDPSFDQAGDPRWQVDPKALPAAATQACGPILQAANVAPARRPPSAAQLAQATRFAQCIRQHGFPDFPDPNPQTGSFDTGGDPTQQPGFTAATRACQSLAPQGKPAS